MLLLCRIGLNLLGCKEVASKIVRDYLHEALPDLSKDKSSAACWARLMRLVQWGRRERTIKLYTSIALNDPVSAISSLDIAIDYYTVRVHRLDAVCRRLPSSRIRSHP